MKIFKNFIIKRCIRKNLKNKVKLQKFNGLNVQKIGCIVDVEAISDTSFLNEFMKFYNIRSENFIVLGYQENGSDTHIGGTPVFSWQDIQFSGTVRNYHADRLLEMQYDILINYFTDPKLPLLLLSSGIKAKLRIGFKEIDPIYNDVILHLDLKNTTIFVEEVKKIIKTIQ